MNKVFIFDVDGTLTPSRLPMDEKFQEFFKEWVKKNTFYLVTGSDISKLQEQMCMYDIEAEAIFTCCGNEMWIPDPHIVNISAYQEYSHKFEPPDDLMKYLEDTLDDSDYPIKAGNHIEDRGSMLNFSMVGRDCTLEERKNYFHYDTLTGERENIAKKGFDKSQVIFEIMHRNVVTSKDDYVFIGDRTMEGGNDYPLAKAMKELSNCQVFQAGEPSSEDGYRRTREILEELDENN